MTTSLKQFDNDKVLEKALDVFWANGYASTSMQDLVNAMSINRASMYDTFGNKEQLFKLAFDRYCEKSLNHFDQTLHKSPSPLINLKQLFMELVGETHDGENYGCFANNAAIELGPHDKDIAKKVREFWQKLESLLDNTLKQAIKNGELPQDTQTADLAALLNTLIQGIAARSKVALPVAEQQRVVAQFLKLLPISK